MFWGPHILKVMYLPFTFKQRPRTESGQWFLKNEMATPSWNLTAQGRFFFLPSKAGRNWKKAYGLTWSI